MKRKQAVIYLRQSAATQASNNLKRQQTMLLAEARRIGLEIVTTISSNSKSKEVS